MSLLCKNVPGQVLLQKDGATVFDTDLKTFGTVPSAKISITGQTIDFPEPNKDTVYYWSGHSSGGFAFETAASFVSFKVAQEWGPQSVDPSYTDDLPDILLGTVPDGTDFLNVKAVITRTKDPDAILLDPMASVVPLGKSIKLHGGSCPLEEAFPLARGFAIVLDGTDVYLRRYQSVAEDMLGAGPAATGGLYTYTHAPGNLVYNIDYFVSGAEGSFSHDRGQSNQLSLTDNTDYQSTYSADLEIEPGFFNTDPTIHPPSTRSAFRMAYLKGVPPSSTPISSVTYSGVPFGLADASRYVLVEINTSNASATSFSVASVTIGGVSASRLVEKNANGTLSAIWMAAVPSGTSGSIVITWSGGSLVPTSWTVMVYALYHLTSATPVDTQSRSSTGSVSLSTADPGFAFVASMHFTSPGASLTGIDTTGYDSFQAGPTGHSGTGQYEAGFQETDGTSLTIGATGSASLNLVACSLH